MGDVWRAICESMPDFPVCALEGCDTVLVGYPWNAIFCSKTCCNKAYDRTPKMKAWHKAYEPKMKAWRKAYVKAYRQTPEYKAYMKAYEKARWARKKAYGKAYRARKKAERLAAIEAE